MPVTKTHSEMAIYAHCKPNVKRTECGNTEWLLLLFFFLLKVEQTVKNCQVTIMWWLFVGTHDCLLEENISPANHDEAGLLLFLHLTFQTFFHLISTCSVTLKHWQHHMHIFNVHFQQHPQYTVTCRHSEIFKPKEFNKLLTVKYTETPKKFNISL